jgi:hypothetical protein
MVDAIPHRRPTWSAFASNEVDLAITARHVMTPMSEAIALAEDTPSNVAASHLRSLGFDQAPVGSGNDLRGYALVRELEDGPGRTVRDVLHQLEPRILVGEEATVETLLHAFLGADMLFVVGKHEVAGFVTQSDLGRPAVRVHFYLHIADLEMALAEKVRRRFGDGSEAVALLADERRNVILERHAEAQRLDVDLDYVSDMDLSDLIRIVGASPDLRVIFGASSRRSWQDRVGRLVELRNYVMHPTKTDLPLWSDVGQLASAEATIRSLIAEAGNTRTESGPP